MYRLDHLNGPQRGTYRIVHRRRLEAGSDLVCSLWARMDGLSPRHAIIEDDGAQVKVQAIAGAPVRINGVEVAEAVLAENDVIEIGPLRVRFSRRRRRLRDFRRAIPVAAVLLAAGAAGVHYIGRHRAADSTDPLETPPFVPPPGSAPPPALRIMETVAERIETTDAAELERLGLELERERDRVLSVPGAPKAPADWNDPVTRRRNAESALTAARRRTEEGRLAEAEVILARLQTAAPDFLDAYAERARLQESQGRIEDALRQWKVILDAGQTSSLHAVAAAETVRLTRQLAANAPATDPASESAPAAPPLSPEPRLRIVSAETSRFPATAEYDEMRLLWLAVRAETPLTEADLDRARVEVVFYDILDGSTTALPTRARSGPERFPLRSATRNAQGDWVVTATYAVPRGRREQDRRSTGRSWRYHGFLVRVFIGDEVQAVEARPRSLAQQR